VKYKHSIQKDFAPVEEDIVRSNTHPSIEVSKDAIELLYAFGHGFYQSGNYKKAMHFFRYLTLLESSCQKHWMGLGASYQMLKQYERALQCYGQAAILDESDPHVHWHAAECFLEIKQFNYASQALNSAETIAKQHPFAHQTLIARIQLTKSVHFGLQKQNK